MRVVAPCSEVRQQRSAVVRNASFHHGVQCAGQRGADCGTFGDPELHDVASVDGQISRSERSTACEKLRERLSELVCRSCPILVFGGMGEGVSALEVAQKLE